MQNGVGAYLAVPAQTRLPARPARLTCSMRARPAALVARRQKRRTPSSSSSSQEDALHAHREQLGLREVAAAREGHTQNTKKQQINRIQILLQFARSCRRGAKALLRSIAVRSSSWRLVMFFALLSRKAQVH